jgi:hypothetical protein
MPMGLMEKRTAVGGIVRRTGFATAGLPIFDPQAFPGRAALVQGPEYFVRFPRKWVAVALGPAGH